jgi:hypothetical protein
MLREGTSATQIAGYLSTSRTERMGVAPDAEGEKAVGSMIVARSTRRR